MSEAVKKIDQTPESFSPKAKPEIISAAEKLQGDDIKPSMEFGEVELVSLPKMLVASYEVTDAEPEQVAIGFVENWLKNRGLAVRKGFGFDCHKGRDIPDGCIGN